MGSLGSQLGRCPEKQSCSRCEGLMDAVGRKGSRCFAIDFEERAVSCTRVCAPPL